MNLLKIKKIFEKNPIALATSDKAGIPYCIVVADVKVVSADQILVGDNYMKKTLENIKVNSKISGVVWNRNWEEMCIGYNFLGKAEYFSKGKWLKKVKKIHQGCPAKGAILITVSKVIKSC
jgi:predicted pyridoxine 5'-phosphate oxidase superfamily flavin-nucleotide-binding protein